VDVFAALADPTRRRIVELISISELSAGAIADQFQVSQPAVSKHLRVLREAGLVASRGDAQRRIYSLNVAALDELDAWSAQTRAFWSNHLARLGTHLEEKA
jgi:DNA-binding transcriptional ArsR family regulator